jgi:hypothetical protein
MVSVVEVNKGSWAAQRGLKAGHVIEKLNGAETEALPPEVILRLMRDIRPLKMEVSRIWEFLEERGGRTWLATTEYGAEPEAEGEPAKGDNNNLAKSAPKEQTIGPNGGTSKSARKRVEAQMAKSADAANNNNNALGKSASATDKSHPTPFRGWKKNIAKDEKRNVRTQQKSYAPYFVDKGSLRI